MGVENGWVNSKLIVDSWDWKVRNERGNLKLKVGTSY